MDGNLSQQELKKLNRSGWAHQLTLAPLFVPLALIGIPELTSGHYAYGLMNESMAFTLYSIYLRYGLRHCGVHERRKSIKDSSLEVMVKSSDE